MSDGDPRAGSVVQPAPDVERLRRERLARCLAAMAAHDLDALVLGREANVRYVSDARRLWLAGSRPFGPGCIVVRATGAIHLLSTSSDGIPARIPPAQLHALTWNPERIVAWLASVPGLRDARRIGVDGWNAAAARLLARAAPTAQLADGDAAMRAARSVKTRTRSPASARGRGRVVRPRCLIAARPGRRRGAAARRVSRAHRVARRHHPVVRARRRPCRAGAADRAPLRRAARRVRGNPGSYLAAVERPLAPRLGDAARRARELRAALFAACRPEASAHDLLDVYRGLGIALPAFPIAQGSGLGCEPPLIGAGHVCDRTWRMEADSVLALSAFVPVDDGGGVLTQDLVHVTASGPELLTPSPYGPLLQSLRSAVARRTCSAR